MKEETDETIWQRVLSGDSRSFGIIWDRHRDRVFGYLLRDGNSRADAEDLSAVAFLELWRRRDSLRFVDESLLPWLIVTTRNVSRNAQRARRRYRHFLGSLPTPDNVRDHAESIAEMQDARYILLRAAIRKASEADATLLTMTVIEGFSVREAAGALGLTESAAKMRLSRLRTRLRLDLVSAPISEGELS